MGRKPKRWLAKIKEFLSSSPNKQAEQCQSIKKILKKLKEQQKLLKEELEDETNKKRKQTIREELAIIKKQRRKAIDELKSLKKRS